jgi:cytochrome c oxidase assembly protein subunit 15
MTRSDSPAGVHRLVVLTLGATLLLIVAGGLVTNTGAALAVPDWPTTFGEPMLLFPWSRMVGGVLFEHSHRLLGALVGLLTVALAGAVWWSDGRRTVRTLAAIAVVAVCAQGLLGGLRVVLLRDQLAIAHGCLAQAFFALLTGLAVLTAPGAADRPGTRSGRDVSRPAGAVLGLLYVQVVLGALTTHAGQVLTHIGGAVVVSLATGALAVRVLAREEVPVLVRPARALVGLLGLQLALGLGAYASRFTSLALPGGDLAVVGFPVAHRATGALLLAAATALALGAWRVRPARLGAEPVIGDRPVVSGEVAA